MDQPGPSQPELTSSTTENPIIALGRKVKSVLGTSQRPSVRIIRSAPVSKGTGEKLASYHSTYGNTPNQSRSGNSFASTLNRAGTSIRSLFSREDSSPNEETFKDEYDPDTVDLLDVVGMYNLLSFERRELTLRRPRSIYPLHSHQCPKLPLRPSTRRSCQSSSNIQTL